MLYLSESTATFKNHISTPLSVSNSSESKPSGAARLRILASGDIHGDSGLASRLAERAVKENVDLVILCGDLTLAEHGTEGIIGPFVKSKKKVLLIPGNHETVATADFLAQLYGVKNLHGESAIYEDVGIFGCGGANIGSHQLSEDEFYSMLSYSNSKVKHLSKRIMVTHVHPSGTLMERFTSIFPGSTGVRKAIEKLQPDILFCSHVHEAEGIEEKIGATRVINVGRKGKIVEI